MADCWKAVWKLEPLPLSVTLPTAGWSEDATPCCAVAPEVSSDFFWHDGKTPANATSAVSNSQVFVIAGLLEVSGGGEESRKRRDGARGYEGTAREA
jgi:hypothetical protein